MKIFFIRGMYQQNSVIHAPYKYDDFTLHIFNFIAETLIFNKIGFNDQWFSVWDFIKFA